MTIKLGPLLGVEANYGYTVCFLSEIKIPKNALKLHLENVDSGENWLCEYESCTKLQSHYFYRFSFSVQKQDEAFAVNYFLSLDEKKLGDSHGREEWEFEVAGQGAMPKIAFSSCNGDSKKHPSKIFKKDFLMWKKMKQNHSRPNERFHLLIMGGDQVYADSIWDEVPIIDSLKVKSKLTSSAVINYKVSPNEGKKLSNQLKAFYEQLYIDSWSDADMSFMLACVPTVMMWDDHDIVDGWGSYEPGLQNSDLFKYIFPIAREYFEVFQGRTTANISRISKAQLSLHFAFRNLEIFVLDNRSFRTVDQVMAPSQYNDLRKALERNLFAEIPPAISKERILCFVIPVPVAHLDYSRLIEILLPQLSKKEFRHSMNDDALDHWDHYRHKTEQKELLNLIFDAGDKHDAKYVCIVSGDVHTAGAATVTKAENNRKITQLISSGTVHKGPNKWEFALMRLATTPKSKVPGYNLQLKNFGSFKKHTINLRNFGILTKASHSGVVASLEMEGRDNLAHRTLNKFRN